MLRLLFVVVFLILLIIFTLSNLDPATSKMIMFDIRMPIGILALIIGTVSAVFGAAVSSIGGFRQRQRARRAEQQVQTLQGQLVALHERKHAARAAAPDLPPEEDASGSTFRP